QHDEIRTMRHEQVSEHLLGGLTCIERFPGYHRGRYPEIARSLDARGLRAIGDDDIDLRMDLFFGAGLSDGQHVRAPAGDQDCKPQWLAGAHPSITTPCDPARTSPMILACSPCAASSFTAASA